MEQFQDKHGVNMDVTIMDILMTIVGEWRLAKVHYVNNRTSVPAGEH
jgi:hypothetical protein